MVGIITDRIERNQALDRQGVDAIPATTGEVIGAAWDDALARNPFPGMVRFAERESANERALMGEIEGDETAPRLLERDEANERYGVDGELTFDGAISETAARQLNRLKREELQRRDVFRRAQGGVLEWTGRLGAGLAASALDPLNIASAFLPVVGPTRYAAWMARAGSGIGRAAVRARVGAIEGAAGAAMVEPLVYGLAQNEQADYDAADSLLNIAFGSVLGGGLHAGFGAIGDRVAGGFARQVEAMPLAEKETALRAAVAAVAEDRPVNIEPLIRASEPRVPVRDAADDVPASIRAFVDEALSARGQSAYLRVGRLTDEVADRIAAAGIDVRGFDHVMQADDIRHSLRRHGPNGARADEIPITPNDIARVPEIIATADEVRDAGRTRQRLQGVMFVKREADGTAYVVEEVRSGKGRLAFKTMYRLRKGGGPEAPAAVPKDPAGPTPEAIPGTAADANISRDPGRDNLADDLEGQSAEFVKSVQSLSRQSAGPYIDERDLSITGDVARLATAAPKAADAPRNLSEAQAMLDAELEKLKAAQVEGRVTEDTPELTEADELIRRAEATGRAYEAAAFCVAGRPA